MSCDLPSRLMCLAIAIWLCAGTSGVALGADALTLVVKFSRFWLIDAITATVRTPINARQSFVSIRTKAHWPLTATAKPLSFREMWKRASSPVASFPPIRMSKCRRRNPGDQLTAQQKDLLRAWVAQGAPWAKHWAFVAPVRPELPTVKEKAWVRNPIDAFVLSRLAAEGLHPSPQASKEKLIRRVTLDLTGLAPTPEEVDAFLADNSSDAYERVVDRLLASPHYGERMTLPWLDAARYADTNGFQGDQNAHVVDLA